MASSCFVKLSYSHSPELQQYPSRLLKKPKSIYAFHGNKRHLIFLRLNMFLNEIAKKCLNFKKIVFQLLSQLVVVFKHLLLQI